MNKIDSSVISFQEDEVALGYIYDSRFPNHFPKHDVLIKSAEYDINFFEDNKIKIIGDKPKSSSDVFLKHPYLDNTYINSNFNNIEDYILRQKIDFYKRAAIALGAKTIKIELENIKKTEHKIDFEAKGNYIKGVKVEVKVDSAKKEELKQKYSSESRFSLQENFNINENIDQLKKFIDKHNLNHEIGLLSLIDARDSRITGNRLDYEKVKSEISSEFNSLKEVGAYLRFPVFSLNSKFKSEVSISTTIGVEIEFVF